MANNEVISTSSFLPLLTSSISNNNLENGNCSDVRIPASSVVSFSSTNSADVCIDLIDEGNDERLPTSTTNFQNLKRTHDDDICSVCNDAATGIHYGTPSCNGCKTFFRRTVMKKQVFKCQFDGNCPVDKSVRCSCRHCRFKKCLEAGMSKESIQNNRDPIGYTKRTRKIQIPTDENNPSSSLETTINTSTAPSTFTNSLEAEAALNTFMNTTIINGTSNNNEQINRQQTISPSIIEHVQEDLLLQRIFGIEYILITIRNSKLNVQKSFNDLLLNSSLFEDPVTIKKMASLSFQTPTTLRRAEQKDHLYWHERDWFIMIEWAKMLPVYQQLDLSDKLSLLRYSAITFPSLIQCFYTPDVGQDAIVFPDGAFFDRKMETDRSMGFHRKNFKMLDNLLDPIRRIKIDQNEFAGAKAVFFLNPGTFEYDADDLSSAAKQKISVARSAITNALYRYMVQKRGPEEAAEKFGKLMLLGTAISTISYEMREAVIVADFFNQIQFSDFARQILFPNNLNNILPNDNSQQSEINNSLNNNQNSLTNQVLTQQNFPSIFNNNFVSSNALPSSQLIIPPSTQVNNNNNIFPSTTTTTNNNNTPMNVLNGLSNYFANNANGIPQQMPIQLQNSIMTNQPQQQYIGSDGSLSYMQQIHASQLQQLQQKTQFQRSSFPMVSATTFGLQQQLLSSASDSRPTTFVTTVGENERNSQQIAQQQIVQQQIAHQYLNQETVRQTTPKLSSLSQSNIISPINPTSHHLTPQQLSETNLQQLQFLTNQNNFVLNNNIPQTTLFDQSNISQTQLNDISSVQLNDQQPFTPTSFFSGLNSSGQSQPSSAQSQNSSPPSVINIQ